MSTNLDSADRVTFQSLANTKTAAATDRHHGQLRKEVQTQAGGEARFSYENNIRRVANQEVGRALNLSTVV